MAHPFFCYLQSSPLFNTPSPPLKKKKKQDPFKLTHSSYLFPKKGTQPHNEQEEEHEAAMLQIQSPCDFGGEAIQVVCDQFRTVRARATE